MMEIDANTFDQIYFDIEKNNPTAGIPALPKAPPYAPTVLVNDNVLVFQGEHPAYVPNLVDNEGNTLFTTEVPESMMEVVLPFNLTEDIEVNLLQGDWRIYGRIDPEHETVKVNDVTSRDENRPVSSSAALYDLQGRRIQDAPIRKGIYVKNGRLVVIK